MGSDEIYKLELYFGMEYIEDSFKPLLQAVNNGFPYLHSIKYLTDGGTLFNSTFSGYYLPP